MSPPIDSDAARPELPEPTRAERWLRGVLIAHAVLSLGFAGFYLFGGARDELGFIPNSVAKDVVFALVSVLAAADVRRRGWLALVVVAGYLGLVAGQIATWAWDGATAGLILWMAADIVLAVFFGALWWWAVRARHGLRYLDPVAFSSLTALAEVVIEGRREVLAPAQVARTVDDYLADLHAKGKWRVRGALLLVGLWPLLTLRPPLAALAPAARKRFLERRFLDPAARRRLPAFARPTIQAAVRTASQMAYLGYYGDRRTWASIGYTPYAKRPGADPVLPLPRLPPLRSLARAPEAPYDTIVVGSGAAGGILAYRLAESGRRVLVVERGPHVDPRRFSDDEVRQYLRLYNEGALQLATNYSLQVLQGMCVGGGTTINNGLCLPPPAGILDEWEAHGVERAGLEDAIACVTAWLGVEPIVETAFSEAARRFAAAAAGLPGGRVEVMAANIAQTCRGCGYCNIGCAFDAKVASLDAVLPQGQRDFPGRLDVLADFHVGRIEHTGGRATGVAGRHAGGAATTLAAAEVVVAAGAIGSSALLHRSGLGGERVGAGLHFNITSPLTAEFPAELPVDAFAGIQMSHAYVVGDGRPAYMVENWFNPPATQALATPGWFDDHFALMHRFRHLACAGVLVGTEDPGAVTAKGEIDFTPSGNDRSRVLRGLQDAARIFLRAGATRVMPATIGFRAYTHEDQLAALPEEVAAAGDLLLTSAHPQGGNAVGSVVDADFRVLGVDGVRLCDASVFPASVRVNPQLTVMGMAEYGARRILAG